MTALVGSLVLRDGQAQVVEDRLRIAADLAHRCLPIRDNWLRGFAPRRRLLVSRRIDLMEAAP